VGKEKGRPGGFAINPYENIGQDVTYLFSTVGATMDMTGVGRDMAANPNDVSWQRFITLISFRKERAIIIWPTRFGWIRSQMTGIVCV
jgi:hypothetical protein